jgi:hypothetical protein
MSFGSWYYLHKEFSRHGYGEVSGGEIIIVSLFGGLFGAPVYVLDRYKREICWFSMYGYDEGQRLWSCGYRD